MCDCEWERFSRLNFDAIVRKHIATNVCLMRRNKLVVEAIEPWKFFVNISRICKFYFFLMVNKTFLKLVLCATLWFFPFIRFCNTLKCLCVCEDEIGLAWVRKGRRTRLKREEVLQKKQKMYIEMSRNSNLISVYTFTAHKLSLRIYISFFSISLSLFRRLKFEWWMIKELRELLRIA